ncbi:hypothetical protein SAMN05444920_102555 [Nonomuraea solani]|uniref:Uncharacterized protein n=1 Tax=Nonomuraea solani TaxID=1144553 RepID=A0A1H5Z8A1_9ACTN|nr:hypothetical protein [Nonomuraea solani]SEG31586.1 hypothetical protein SAMN05444920_102555 [Nonomuraea solani]
MTDLEERLRAAFDARASTYEASPHAWARIRERGPKRRAARFVLAALPVALLAVFVPVLLNGGLGRNTAADPGEIYQRLMRDRTATGEEVTVDNPTEGLPLRLWFAKARLGYPELCFVMERAEAEPYGGCTGVSEDVNADAWFTGSTLRDGTETALDWGVALGDVGGVTGVAKDGRRFAGTVLRPAGAPYRIWTVTYPARHAMSEIEIADDRGKDLGSWSRDLMTPPVGEPVGAAVELSQGLSVRPHRAQQGTELFWTRHGANIQGMALGGELPGVTTFVREDMVFGFARANVAVVEIVFDGGQTARMETRPDPWNLGLTLFAAENPAGDRRDGHRLVAYDASGAEVWRDDRAGQPMREDMPPIGEVMTIPGTDGSGDPMRAWFTNVAKDKKMATLCLSGGVAVGDQGGDGCVGTMPGSFVHLYATRFLPEPGIVTHAGPAGEDWESIEAVLGDGRKVPAAFLRGKGTPASIWHVTVPGGEVKVAGFLLKVKDRPSRSIPVAGNDCASTAARSDAARQRLAAGISALVSEPSCLAFWQNDRLIPSLEGPLPGGKLSDMLGTGQRVQWRLGANTWYGYAPAGTVTVKAVTTNGVTVTADAVPDQWGQGVTLFAAATPEGADFSAGTVVTGHDAGGEELWRSGS